LVAATLSPRSKRRVRAARCWRACWAVDTRRRRTWRGCGP
jgi:hypothetical protein